jgi:ParB family chromosome partitioning protein
MSEDTPLRKRPSGLGRGLSSLLGEVAQEAPVHGAPQAPG